MKNDEVATIESLVTDQGNGSSWCSACNHPIDIFRLSIKHLAKEPWHCPNCKRLLTFGKIDSYGFGGSDF